MLGLACAFVGASLFCASSFASDADTPQQRVVRFADLNLDRPEGIATLYARLRFAARQVCDDEEPDLVLRMLSNTCVVRATERAVAEINSPALTSYYQQRREDRSAYRVDGPGGR
jgi:UrcA family protein